MMLEVLLAALMLLLPLALAQGAPPPPRPDYARPLWQSLNGEWEFAFDPENVGARQGWQQPDAPAYPLRIKVPFPWESQLSGVHRLDYQGVAWYRRQFLLPAGWQGQRIWVCFGAVDWQAAVWLNGQPVGEHEGGYSEFRLEITRQVRPDGPNTLVVRAEDHTDGHTPIGKQVSRWYTSTSGIWQTVWLEATGPALLRRCCFTPLADGEHRPTGEVRVELAVERGEVQGELEVVVRSPQRRFAEARALLPAGREDASLVLRVPNPRFWTPETPVLYPALVELRPPGGQAADTVETYFGLRTVAWGTVGGSDHSYVLLNGRPVYLCGALDQSFNPEGIYTGPDDDFLRRDIELAKAAGLNMLRIHIKAEEPRRLYWADRLGLLIQADMPCAYQISERARQTFELTMRDTIARDYNHPSIYCWTIFNEEWGIGKLKSAPREHRVDWVQRMWHLARQLDRTRLVQDNTGWSHLVSDLNSFHYYDRDVDGFRRRYREINDTQIKSGSPWNYIAEGRQRGEPFVNNEFGSVGAGSGDSDWSWGVLQLVNAMRACPRLVGYTYTELTDLEWEHNGIYNYDRSPKEFGYDFWAPGMALPDVFARDFLVLDVPAVKQARPGEQVRVPALFSHYTGNHSRGVTLCWQVRWLDSLGLWHQEPVRAHPCGATPPYRLTPLTDINFALPDQPGLVTLAAWLEAGGHRLHTNYTQWRVGTGQPLPRAQLWDAQTVLLRFRPEDWAHSEFADPAQPPPGKHYGRGPGLVEYRLRLPADLPLADLQGVELVCELAAKAGREKVDWPQRVHPDDYPQTDGKKFPSQVQVLLGGEPVAAWHLPDDPADARGVLSHWAGREYGSYGYRMQAGVGAGSPQGARLLQALREQGRLSIVFQVPREASHPGGFALYGEEMGCYPLDPTVILRFSRRLELPAGWASQESVSEGR